MSGERESDKENSEKGVCVLSQLYVYFHKEKRKMIIFEQLGRKPWNHIKENKEGANDFVFCGPLLGRMKVFFWTILTVKRLVGNSPLPFEGILHCHGLYIAMVCPHKQKD